MCRKVWLSLIVIALALSMAGCGVKDAKEVVSDLSKRSEEMESYVSHGKMTIRSGKEPQLYDIEVWYKKPHFFRVAIKNMKKGITQILLRNEEGVYVLTPHLKKSFRFQSDWPYSGGQVYLYQTVIQSIIDDNERTFRAGKKQYQFEVVAKYPFNLHANKQRIWLDHKLNPHKVAVLSESNEELIKVEFDRFKEGASFDKDAFDMKRNLEELPQDSKTSLAAMAKPSAKQKEIEAVLPEYIPQGTRLQSERTIQTPQGPVVVMRFKGDKSFTLTERHPQALEAGLPLMGKPVELAETVGVLLEMGERKRLTWTEGGVDYELIGNLSLDELVQIANSTYNQSSK
ncbi:outer membrane lipoprotein-sorting protein [Laceyella sediminis]|jgi:outer membrane lipoprotein-sorting protein|uniref:Outer membrane lipoprotein-sorting protein n=1 Tax=Laceyella sediminis TaxID=573074 RepID=A0ABX5EMG5_9BACL|nr:outer membrane lipoprotein carrier protein LolA [Laceyella sediminis]PRZ11985.1 outer membrane lipoprotein-sorting protein [Laceyella sediminis]